MKALKVIGTIIAIFLCIIMFSMELVTHSIFGVSKVLSKDNIQEIISSLDTKSLFEDEKGQKTKLYYEIIDNVGDEGLDKEKLEKILTSDGLKTVVGTVLGNMSSTFFFNEDFITKEEFVKLVDDNLDQAVAEAGMVLSPEERAEIIRLVNEYGEELFETMEQEVNSREQSMYLFPVLLGTQIKIFFVGIIVILVLLVCLCKWSIIKGIKYSSVATIASGTIILTLGMVLSLISLADFQTTDIEVYKSIVVPAVENIGKVFAVNGGISVVIGIILVIVMSKLNKSPHQNINI